MGRITHRVQCTWQQLGWAIKVALGGLWLYLTKTYSQHVGGSGFHTEGGGGAGIPPPPPPSHNFPPPEILKLSMVIIVLSQVLNKNLVPDCNLRGSKIQNFFLGGACPSLDPLVGMHAYTCVSVLSHATVTILFPPPPPPPQLKNPV